MHHAIRAVIPKLAPPHIQPEMCQQRRDNNPHRDLRDEERRDRTGEQTLVRMPVVADLRLGVAFYLTGEVILSDSNEPPAAWPSKR